MKLPRIQICAGAGCKAWDSEKLACELERIQEWGDTADYEIQLVPQYEELRRWDIGQIKRMQIDGFKVSYHRGSIRSA